MIYPLLPLAWVYDGVTSIRNFMYDHGILSSESYDLPIICIGNLTVGGTGKTPHTEYLIRLLQNEGYKVAVLSRGYKRKTKGFVLADEFSSADDIGDEPYQMKSKFPNLIVAVDADRREGIYNLITTLQTSKVDVILLDDAFQHRKVHAGLNILLTDSNRPIFDDYLLPAGRLRENKKGLNRADIVVVTKLKSLDEGKAALYSYKLNLQPEQTLYFSGFKYSKIYNKKTTISLEELSNYNVLLITGIANPKPLEDELRKYTDYDSVQFGDHHDFTEQDYKLINKAYESLPDDKPRIIITTEKDMARINEDAIMVSDSLFAIPIEVEILRDEQSIFNNQILDYVRKNSRNSSISQSEND